MAWNKCKSLKLSKDLPLVDKFFKIDMYGAVVSLFGISGGATGIQLDHIFPDKLGGPNTLANAAPIHWRANNIKSDTPREFLDLTPDGKDWFSETQFIKCAKEYGIWCLLGKTPLAGIKEKEELMTLEQEIKNYVKPPKKPSSPKCQ